MKRTLHLLAILLLCCPLLRAQSACDSLDIDVAYNAFYDSLIEIHVVNHSTKYFSYPGFIIYDSNNDTVAKEKVNLFGIAQSSSHVLERYPNMPVSSSFMGTLEFYTDFYDTLRCTFPMNFDLCPDTCQPAVIYLGNMGGALFTGTVNYSVENSSGQMVKSGVLTITPNEQYDADTACLNPGSYKLHLSQINLTGGGAKHYGILQSEMNIVAPVWNYNASSDTVFAFDFYKNCTLPTGVKDMSNAAEMFHVFAGNGAIEVTGIAQYPLESVTIYSIDGRMVSNEKINATHYKRYVPDLASGIYVVQVKQHGRYAARKVFIENN